MTRSQRSLIITREGSEPTELKLEPGLYRVGREDGNNLIINHPSIAPRHCELTVFEDGGLVVRQLTTEHETSIDGVPVGVAGLGPGQRLRLGEVDCWVADAEVSGAGEDSPSTHPHTVPRPISNAPPAAHPATTTGTPAGFWGAIPGTLLYPARGDAWIPLLFLVGLTSLPWFLPAALQVIGLGTSFLIGAYLIQLAKAIVLTTGEDPSEPFPSPEVSFQPDDLREAVLSLFGLGLVCFGPAILLQWIPNAPTWTRLLFLALGCFYLPMALLAWIVSDHFGAVSPTTVIPSILRAPLAYGVVAAVFGTILAAGALMGGMSVPINHARPLGLAFAVGSSAVGFYLLIAWLRCLGLFFHHHRKQLAWGL